jgi:hypothetical protein
MVVANKQNESIVQPTLEMERLRGSSTASIFVYSI